MNFWEGKLVRLRALEPADAETFYEWNHDSDISRALDYVWVPSSREYQRQWAAKTAVQPPQNDAFMWAIETLDGQPVGSISSHHCDRRTGAFMYGIAVAAPFRGQGYASEAILLVLRYFFEELRYQKVTVDVYSFNEASVRLHESLGFQLEGRIRRTVYTQGQHFDQLMYGLTVEEYRARYGARP
jgi:RimJ/RimL family protein N-acetyltransferase